jgi:AraC-like DNA-binding protein
MSKYLHYEIPGIVLGYGIDETPNDSSFSVHVHDDYELHCVVTGKVGYMVEGRIYDLRPGGMMIMRRTESHRLLVNGNERYERYTLNFRPEVLEAHGFPKEIMTAFHDRGLGERNLYLPGEFQGIEPVGMFRQMMACCDVLPPEEVLVSHLATLLCAVNSVFLQRPETRYSEEELGRRLINYINDNLFEELSLSLISEEIHMSPSQINRVFHGLTGTSVYHYILSKRLIVAQDMIAKGESAVSASQKCGFRDYSSFYRLYKKRLGTAPTAAKRKKET